MPKFKIITKLGDVFLYRISFPLRAGSIKIHLIVNDDVGEAHIHPWIFTSFLAIGAYKEYVDGRELRHLPLSFVKYGSSKRHKIRLYRAFGIKIPCLTVGLYSEKLQPWCEQATLCELCRAHGQCLDKQYWSTVANDIHPGHVVEVARKRAV